MSEKVEDKSMERVRALFEGSGLSLHSLGVKMGYASEIARQSAFQFMKAGDPRVSMLRRFAKAMGVDVRDLLGDGKGKRVRRDQSQET